MKLAIITFLLLFTNILLAQKDDQESYQYEVELGTDNDFLVFLQNLIDTILMELMPLLDGVMNVLFF